MKISVQLFAGLREVMGSDLLTVNLDQDLVSVAALRQALETEYPKLKPYLSGAVSYTHLTLPTKA